MSSARDREIEDLKRRLSRAERVTNLHQKLGGPDAPYKQTKEWKDRH